jgi:hypothetical protein
MIAPMHHSNQRWAWFSVHSHQPQQNHAETQRVVPSLKRSGVHISTQTTWTHTRDANSTTTDVTIIIIIIKTAERHTTCLHLKRPNPGPMFCQKLDHSAATASSPKAADH